MRCQCCNKNLSKKDSVIRYQSTNEFADLCGECRQEIGPDVEYIIPDIQDEFYDDEISGDYDDSEEEH